MRKELAAMKKTKRAVLLVLYIVGSITLIVTINVVIPTVLGIGC